MRRRPCAGDADLGRCFLFPGVLRAELYVSQRHRRAACRSGTDLARTMSWRRTSSSHKHGFCSTRTAVTASGEVVCRAMAHGLPWCYLYRTRRPGRGPGDWEGWQARVMYVHISDTQSQKTPAGRGWSWAAGGVGSIIHLDARIWYDGTSKSGVASRTAGRAIGEGPARDGGEAKRFSGHLTGARKRRGFRL